MAESSNIITTLFNIMTLSERLSNNLVLMTIKHSFYTISAIFHIAFLKTRSGNLSV
jgi:bacteriorhodopsin